MTLLLAIIIGLLFSGGTLLLLQRSLIRILFGLGLLNHGGNLLVLAMSGNPKGKLAPIVQTGMGTYADPIPQALILTAIVIGFGVTAFVIVLFYRIFQAGKTTDLEAL